MFVCMYVCICIYVCTYECVACVRAYRYKHVHALAGDKSLQSGYMYICMRRNIGSRLVLIRVASFDCALSLWSRVMSYLRKIKRIREKERKKEGAGIL